MFYLIGMDAACIYVCRTTGMWGDGRDDGDGRGWL
jgi:hypothetical protein